jgi:azurin
MNLPPRFLTLLAIVCAMLQPVSFAAQGSSEPKTLKLTMRVLPGLVKFETTRFEVNAGARVELTFINDCVMPHNLVLLYPDAEPSVIAAVNTMGLEGMEKSFVPSVPGIVAATKLLAPTNKEVLSFNAPDKEGEYPYVCTFPGHWYTMRGVMRVRGAGEKLETALKSAEKVTQVEDALKNSGVTHKPLGTFDKPLVMRTFAPDPDLDSAVFAHHGVGKDAVKYDPATRLDITEKQKDLATGVERDMPVVRKAEKGVAGAIAVNHGAEFSYVWDSTECRLLYAWRGGFLDMNRYWGKEPGGGRDKMYVPVLMGHLVYRASGANPIAESRDSAPVFLGYRMIGGAPEFRYRIRDRVFSEMVIPFEKEGFEVRVKQEGLEKAPQWNVSAGDADVVNVRSEKGQLIVSIKDRPEQPQLKAGETQEKKAKNP